MKHRLTILYFLCFVLTTLSAHRVDAGMACALLNEKRALDAMAMQSQLMVAAISCGEHKNYNTFVRRFNSEFAEYGRHLRSYFQRNYHGDAENQMNKFVTYLANEYSKRSLDQQSEYFCADANQLFYRVTTPDVHHLSDLTEQKEFTSLYDITSCE